MTHKVKSKRVLKDIRCGCSPRECNIDTCLCPKHYLGKKEWEKAVIKILTKKYFIYETLPLIIKKSKNGKS